jgi:hypothetical protein
MSRPDRRRYREPQTDLSIVAPDDVPGCSAHTAVDQHGDRIRIARCTRGCRAWIETQRELPLAKFLARLITAKTADLEKMDLEQAADAAVEAYGIRRADATGYMALELKQRGIAV